MIEVTVYSVAQNVQVVPDMSRQIERFDYHRGDAYVAEGGLFNLGENLTRTFIPIRQINRHTALYNRGSLSDTDYVTETRYIAIDPELEEVINLPVKQELIEMRNKYFATLKKRNDIQEDLSKLEQDIETWWNAPWYKRVWSALCK
jgi:hypothetical protein